MRNENGTFKRTITLWSEDDWENGYFDNKGRFRVYRPDCPRSYADGYALRAHVVYWLHTGSCHPKNTELHHIDKTKDNDTFENLIPLTHSKHQLEHKENWVFLTCENCGKEFREHAWRANKRKIRFCSQVCYHSAPRLESHKNAISLGVTLAHKMNK